MVEMLDSIVETYRKNCRFPYANIVWKHPRSVAQTDRTNREPAWNESGGTKPWYHSFPFVRPIIGGTLLGVGTPSFIRKYEAPLRKEP